MANKMAKELSHIPSEAILQALEDLEIVEKNPAYRIDMTSWHRPTGDVCDVCLAGCVMVERFNVPISADMGPNDARMHGIDSFRTGQISRGLHYFGIKDTNYASKCIPYYSEDPKGFKLAMRNLAEWLKQEGF